MKKGIGFLFAVVLIAGFSWADGSAQMVNEHHYLLYNTDVSWTWEGQITLWDQFDPDYGPTFIDYAYMEFVANPVQTDGEGDPGAVEHQTWWRIDDPHVEEARIDLENQFGPARWYTKDGIYLVLPALKFNEGEPVHYNVPIRNHYKCYEVTHVVDADGVIVPPYSLDIPVDLTDQWWNYTPTVMEPLMFCNPCAKAHEDPGLGDYPVIDGQPHLAVYNVIDPLPWGYGAAWVDQFSVAVSPYLYWGVFAEAAYKLAVPSIKLTWVGTEENTWGGVKDLYR